MLMIYFNAVLSIVFVLIIAEVTAPMILNDPHIAHRPSDERQRFVLHYFQCFMLHHLYVYVLYTYMTHVCMVKYVVHV